MTEVLYNSKIKPEHLARKAIVYLRQSRAKNKYDRIRKVNSSSMRWPNGYARWAGSKSKSSIVIWDRARALPPLGAKASSVSSARWHWERSESSAAERYRGYPARTKTGVGCWRSARSLGRLSLTSNRSFGSSPLLVKDRYQNAGHEIDQIGECRCIHWHGTASLWDHQVQKLKL